MKLSPSVTFILAFLMVSCAEDKPSYSQSLSMRPLPTDNVGVADECSWIRSEIARMNAIKRQSTASQFAVYFGAQADQNIAALESRAANIGCYQSFSPRTGAVSPKPEKSLIQQCIDACLTSTNRSTGQCFDDCNK